MTIVLNSMGLGIQLTMEENISSSADEVNQSFESVQQSAEQTVQSVSQSMQTFQNIAIGGMALDQAGQSVMNFGNMITGAFARVGQKTMGITSLFEKFRITMGTLFDDGDKVLEWAINMGKTTPFETKTLISGMLSLKGLGIDAREEMEGLNNESQKLVSWIGDLAGLRPDRGITGAMHAAQNFMMGRQKSLQIGYGMHVQEVLGEDIGDSVEERASQFARMVSKRGATGLMSKLEGTWMQMMSNLIDYRDDFLRGIGEAGIFEDVKATVTNFVEALNGVDFAETGKALSEVLSTLYKPVDMLARGLTSLTAKFLDFAQRYPAMTKLFGVMLGGIGVTATLSGILMKLSGGFMMVFSSVGMLVTQLALLSTVSNTANSAILGLAGGMKAMLGVLSTLTLGAGLAFYAWQRNLYGFRTTMEDLIDSVLDNEVFDKLQALGKLFYNLFAEDTGDGVYFSESLRQELESLDLWEFAVQMTMLKGRVSTIIEGMYESIAEVFGGIQDVFEATTEPLEYLNEEFGIFDGLLEDINSTKLGKFRLVGNALGYISSFFIGMKLLGGLRLLGTVLGFIAKKVLFFAGGWKIVLGLGIVAFLYEFTDLGDLVEKSANKMSTAFDELADFVSPLGDIFEDFTNNIPEVGWGESFQIAVAQLTDWWEGEGKPTVNGIMFDMRRSLKDLASSLREKVENSIDNAITAMQDFSFEDFKNSISLKTEAVLDFFDIDFSLSGTLSKGMDLRAKAFDYLNSTLDFFTDKGRIYEIANITSKFIFNSLEWGLDKIKDIGKSLWDTLLGKTEDSDRLKKSGHNLLYSMKELALSFGEFLIQSITGLVTGIVEAFNEDIDISWKQVKDYAEETFDPSNLFENLREEVTVKTKAILDFFDLDISFDDIVASGYDLASKAIDMLSSTFDFFTEDGRTYEITRIATKLTFNAVQFALGKIFDFGKKIIDMILVDSDDVTESKKGLGLSIFELSVAFGKFLFQGLLGIGAGLIEAFNPQLDLALDSIKDYFKDGFDPLKWAKDAWELFTSWQPSVPKVFKDMFSWGEEGDNIPQPSAEKTVREQAMYNINNDNDATAGRRGNVSSTKNEQSINVQGMEIKFEQANVPDNMTPRDYALLIFEEIRKIEREDEQRNWRN